MLAFGVYLAAPVEQISDARYLGAVSDALLMDGTLALPPGFASADEPYQLMLVDGRPRHRFPNAPAILNLPFALPFRLLGRPSLDDDGVYRLENEASMLATSAAFTMALTVALGFLTSRRFAGRGAAVALAIAFAFGTQLLSTASRPYWSHAWGVLLLTAALFLAVAAPRRRWIWAVVGTLLSWAVFCRPTFAISALAVTAWLLIDSRRRRYLPYVVASGAVWLILFALHSELVYGQALPPYFYSEQVSSHRWRPDRLFSLRHHAVIGTLVSPGRGLFVFSPFLATIPAALVWRWRSIPNRALAAAGLFAVAAHWYLVASFRNWWGGFSYGPRLLTDSIPWWWLLAALAFSGATSARARPLVRRAAIGLIAALAAASIAIHWQGAFSMATKTWGRLTWAPPASRRLLFQRERLFNWRYPQFLAGWIPPPPPRTLRIPQCGGREALAVRSCTPRMRLAVRGRPGDRVAIAVGSEDPLEVRLGKRGRAIARLPTPLLQTGKATAVHACGSVVTIDFDCSTINDSRRLRRGRPAARGDGRGAGGPDQLPTVAPEMRPRRRPMRESPG